MDEVIIELEHIHYTPALDLVQLHIVVVGGELTSTDRDDGCDEDKVTFIPKMSAIVTYEMSASMEDCKELPVVASPPKLAQWHIMRNMLLRALM